MIDTKNKAKEAIDRYVNMIKVLKNNKIKNASKVLKKRDGFVSKYVEELAKKEGYL